jgi:4-hydroxybenzoate polyprenyltransferase
MIDRNFIPLTRVQRSLYPLGLFVRFSTLGVTTVIALLGAASVMPYPSNRTLLGILGVGLAFHLFAYVTNDVVDLPLDRTEPRRADFPLVRGTVTRRQALTFALVMFPLAVALTIWMEGNSRAYAALGTSFLLMLAYNLWGKRAPFPPLTDMIQGLAWGSFVLYGAAITATTFTPATTVIFVYVVIFILLTNGVHGSLRDLTNDLRCGVRSTAILLGARPHPGGGLRIPPDLRAYALVLNVILICLALLPLIANCYGYTQSAWVWTIGAVALLCALSLGTLLTAARSTKNPRETNSVGMLHLFLMMSIPIVLLVPTMNGPLLILSVTIFVLPLLTHSWFLDALRWVLKRGRIS